MCSRLGGFSRLDAQKIQISSKKAQKSSKRAISFLSFPSWTLIATWNLFQENRRDAWNHLLQPPYYSAQKSRVIFRECYVRCLIFLVRLVIKGSLYKIFGCFPAASIQGRLVIKGGLYPWQYGMHFESPAVWAEQAILESKCEIAHGMQ